MSWTAYSWLLNRITGEYKAIKRRYIGGVYCYYIGAYHKLSKEDFIEYIPLYSEHKNRQDV